MTWEYAYLIQSYNQSLGRTLSRSEVHFASGEVSHVRAFATEDVLATLSELGSEGWELVTVDRTFYGQQAETWIYWLKRFVNPPADSN
jgi:4-hydroxyphenylpyruvate dioxygenase-like putative hemolysin